MDSKGRSRDLRKGRTSIPGQVYLVTATTHRRRPLFRDLAAGRLVVGAMRWQHEHQRVVSLAYVVMPDHLHWLVELGQGSSLAEVMRAVKAFSGRRINERVGSPGAPVWQDGYHDHALRREEDVRAVARYIAANPLRAGLVEDIGRYPLWDAAWL